MKKVMSSTESPLTHSNLICEFFFLRCWASKNLNWTNIYFSSKKSPIPFCWFAVKEWRRMPVILCWIFNFPSYLTNLVSRLSRGSKIAKWNNKRCFIENLWFRCLSHPIVTCMNLLQFSIQIIKLTNPKDKISLQNILMMKFLPLFLFLWFVGDWMKNCKL